jgi:hypothetical protein
MGHDPQGWRRRSARHALGFTTLLVFSFFEVLPHHAVGVSEVHFILGSTLYLIFGAGPAAIGLALGLLIQGVLSSPPSTCRNTA